MKPTSILSHFRLTSLAAASAILLTSCASYRDIVPVNTPLTRVDLSAPTGIASAREARDVWPQDGWWKAYGDPQLNRLIDHALANSPTLATAQSRIARAQSARQQTQAAASPQVNASVDASYGRLSENYQVPKPPLGQGGEYVSQGRAVVDFSYELDLWGKNAALIRSADAQTKAAIHDRDAARLALTTSIARTYGQLAAQYELQDITFAMQKQRLAIRDLARKRAANGLDTQIDVKQAESGEAALRIELSQLATAIEATRLQLAALTGAMPATAKDITRPSLSIAPFSIPQTLPLDLLGRRPELAAQRARIDAALGDVDAAKAQFYPNINLTGLIGFQSIGLGQLLSAGSLTNSIGPAIRLPIFDSGRLRAGYAARIAGVDEAISQYNQSVVTAAQDVAEQLTRLAALSREDEAARDALAAAEEAHRLTLLRYRAELSPYLTVLTTEAQLLAQRRAMADLKARRYDVQIALLRALGGGFNDAVSSQPMTAAK